MKNVISAAALCLFVASCNNGKSMTENVGGIRPENLDTTAVPGADFYQYACGGWMKANPITDEYARFGSFDQLAENNRKQIQGLIEELAARDNTPGSVEQKIGDLYKVVMDSAKLNADGIAPIQPDLDEIAALKSSKEVYALLGELQKKGVYAYNVVYVSADAKNSAMNTIYAGQTGLSMGEREYYIDTDEATTRIREAFKQHVVKMLRLAGFDETKAQQGMRIVMQVETELAKAYRSRTELRNMQANYNKMTMAELENFVPTFRWDAYFQALGLADVKEVVVGQPASLQAAARILHTLPVSEQVAYLQWKLIDAAAGCLNDAMAEQNFDFYGRTMSGAQEMQPRWKRAVSTVSNALGEAVGQMYVERYFPAAAKERMTALVKNLQTALGQRIDALTWMSDSTKAKAHEKLAAFKVKIGYPDKWKDYSTLDIQNDSYWANAKRANLWEHTDMVGKAGKPVDPAEWHMTPQTVNAYYSPSTNEICFPAGILQYPFFDMQADDAFNYGAIGVVIGHEMTHGFDDQGRQFDKEGNMKNWWTAADSKQFDQRAQGMVDYFDRIEVAPGVHANGRMTLGENIADQGGLQISFQAYKQATAGQPAEVIDGFTPDQRFFLAYAGVWAGNIRPEEVLNRTKSDVHSLGRWRVNGALPHIDAWYEAFGVKEGDALFVPQAQRVSIW